MAARSGRILENSARNASLHWIGTRDGQLEGLVKIRVPDFIQIFDKLMVEEII